MEPFFELVIADSVPVIAQVLGIPEDTVELAVRHTFHCRNQPCEVEQFLNQRMLEATARDSGIPPERLLELVSSVAKSAGDTLHLREKSGERITPEHVRDAYRRGREATEAGMRLILGEQR